MAAKSSWPATPRTRKRRYWSRSGQPVLHHHHRADGVGSLDRGDVVAPRCEAAARGGRAPPGGSAGPWRGRCGRRAPPQSVTGEHLGGVGLGGVQQPPLGASLRHAQRHQPPRGAAPTTPPKLRARRGAPVPAPPQVAGPRRTPRPTAADQLGSRHVLDLVDHRGQPPGHPAAAHRRARPATPPARPPRRPAGRSPPCVSRRDLLPGEGPLDCRQPGPAPVPPARTPAPPRPAPSRRCNPATIVVAVGH